MATKKLSAARQQKALAVVAAWLGKKGMTEDGSPAPTGPEAASSALGPQLVSDWDWPGSPTPTILLEGGPYDWAYNVAHVVTAKVPGVFAEPYANYALCLYVD